MAQQATSPGSELVALRRSEGRLLRVGQLAKATGKTVRALHLYEELGLLKPARRSAGGFRLYAPETKERIAWITKLQAMGFALQDIQSFLHDWEQSASAPEAMRRVREVFERKLAETRSQIRALSELESDLHASLAYLDSCRSCEPVVDGHRREQNECAECTMHGGADAPVLVAGMQEPSTHGTEDPTLPV